MRDTIITDYDNLYFNRPVKSKNIRKVIEYKNSFQIEHEFGNYIDSAVIPKNTMTELEIERFIYYCDLCKIEIIKGEV